MFLDFFVWLTLSLLALLFPFISYNTYLPAYLTLLDCCFLVVGVFAVSFGSDLPKLDFVFGQLLYPICRKDIATIVLH